MLQWQGFQRVEKPIRNRGEGFPHLRKIKTKSERNQTWVSLLEEERKTFKELFAGPWVSHLVHALLAQVRIALGPCFLQNHIPAVCSRRAVRTHHATSSSPCLPAPISLFVRLARLSAAFGSFLGSGCCLPSVLGRPNRKLCRLRNTSSISPSPVTALIWSSLMPKSHGGGRREQDERKKAGRGWVLYLYFSRQAWIKVLPNIPAEMFWAACSVPRGCITEWPFSEENTWKACGRELVFHQAKWSSSEEPQHAGWGRKA